MQASEALCCQVGLQCKSLGPPARRRLSPEPLSVMPQTSVKGSSPDTQVHFCSHAYEIIFLYRDHLLNTYCHLTIAHPEVW